MPFDASVRAYLRAYQNEYRAALHGGQHTAELSFRVPMHEMFRRIAHDLNPAGTFDIILEPRNQGRMGRPDWRIQDRISLGVYGYIEAKGPSNEPFDTTPYRDQINRYLTLGHKLIITDGIDFVFCFTETPVVVSIIDKARMDALDWSRLPVDPLFRFYMEQFFSNPVPFPVSWTVKMKKKQKETQDILSYHTQAAGCSDKARAKAFGGRQPIEECGRTGL